jgi:RNA polymerase sigma-70 factor (ECF subfamily)
VQRWGREGRYARLGDEDLISLVGSYDTRALAALYDRHSHAAYRMAYRLMNERRQAAEDLTLDAFLKVWRSAGSYRPERGNVRSWVLSIVRNRGIEIRSLASRRRAQDRVERSALSPNPDPSPARPPVARGLPSANCRAWGVMHPLIHVWAGALVGGHSGCMLKASL